MIKSCYCFTKHLKWHLTNRCVKLFHLDCFPHHFAHISYSLLWYRYWKIKSRLILRYQSWLYCPFHTHIVLVKKIFILKKYKKNTKMHLQGRQWKYSSVCWIDLFCHECRRLDDRFVHFSAFTQSFLLSIRASSHCWVMSLIFICRLSVSHLWWDLWKLRTVPCPLLPCGLQTLGRVCFACSAEWKLFPPSGRWCSVCSPFRRLGKRAAIKSDLPQCLMVAKWCKLRNQNASQWPSQSGTWLLEP